MGDANFGAIGMIIGHEIVHGFDDQGRKFDAKGNLRDWWTPEDARRYEERGKCISDEYTQEIPDLGVKQNGLLTQGEDTADNGGMRLALRRDGEHPRRARRVPGREGTRRADQRPALLRRPRLRLVQQHAAGDRAHGGGHEPPLAPQVPGEQRGGQHARVRAGLRLQEGSADGAGERLPHLVTR